MTKKLYGTFPERPEQEARRETMGAELERKHFLASANQWSDPVTQRWPYGYEAEAFMQGAWERAGTQLVRKAWSQRGD
ncbi:hypothetical protein V502_02055 [Pseudogymnoascus sp. VKM F-4520 (FW-2644)]|nr:hypothetical protein V502_02055 [Pseudogymnoascus sp. VKM F-4520 (FW-2644)]